MAKKNRRGAQVLRWIKDHPGSLAREIGAGVGYDHQNGLLTYMVRQKMVFVAGPRHWQRYYSTAEDAAANHERIKKEAEAEKRRKIEQCWREQTLRRRQKRAEEGARLAHKSRLPEGVKISPRVNFVAAPKPAERFATDDAPSFFRSLAIGSYLPSDTHLARVYGGSV